MPETFVLFHGAWHTGEDFKTIANILRDAGHTVLLPNVTGNRPEDNGSKLGLEDAISSVVEFIEESDLTDIRLVGHSYAGMVISGVADRLERRQRLLVYINCQQDISLPHSYPWHPRLSERLGLFRLVEMPGSHETIFSNPAGLAQAIWEAARD